MENVSDKSDGNRVIRVVQGDLLKQDVEVLVNPWNRNVIPYWLLMPRGVSGALLKAAGNEPFRELTEAGPLPLGGATLTGPGRIRTLKGIIHVASLDFSLAGVPGRRSGFGDKCDGNCQPAELSLGRLPRPRRGCWRPGTGRRLPDPVRHPDRNPDHGGGSYCSLSQGIQPLNASAPCFTLVRLRRPAEFTLWRERKSWLPDTAPLFLGLHLCNFRDRFRLGPC